MEEISLKAIASFVRCQSMSKSRNFRVKHDNYYCSAKPWLRITWLKWNNKPCKWLRNGSAHFTVTHSINTIGFERFMISALVQVIHVTVSSGSLLYCQMYLVSVRSSSLAKWCTKTKTYGQTFGHYISTEKCSCRDKSLVQQLADNLSHNLSTCRRNRLRNG